MVRIHSNKIKLTERRIQWHCFFYPTAQLLLINLNYGLTHESITIKHQIEQLHKYKTNVPAVCSGLSVYETNIATIGEDGRLVLETNYYLISNYLN